MLHAFFSCLDHAISTLLGPSRVLAGDVTFFDLGKLSPHRQKQGFCLEPIPFKSVAPELPSSSPHSPFLSSRFSSNNQFPSKQTHNRIASSSCSLDSPTSQNTFTMAQPRSRAPLILGLTAAGGVGYYLYSAGGSPKVAQKKVEGT